MLTVSYAREVINSQGDDSAEVHTHSYSSSVTKSPTCTGTGVRTYKCSCGDSYTETIAATGHSMSGWESISGYMHKRVCDNDCGYKETEACNQSNKVAYGDDDWHHMQCSTCSFTWPSSYDKKHNWAHQEGVHTCGDCGEAVAGEYHYYDVAGEAKESYTCKYTAHGNPCSYTVGLAGPSFSGLPMDQYACSDALVKMPPVPEHPKGIQQFSYTGTLRASATAAPYTDLVSPPTWFALFGWWQRNVVSHATDGQVTSMSEIRKTDPGLADAIDNPKPNGDVYTYYYVNSIQNGLVSSWDTTSGLRCFWSYYCWDGCLFTRRRI